MDLLRIKSRSRSPTRAAAAEHKRQSTTSPARSAFTGFGGDSRGDRNSSSALALDEKQASINANAVDVVELSFPSLLNPPNPAFVSGSEARGILINARRPTSRERGTLGDGDLSRVRTTSTLSSTGTVGGHSTTTSTVSSPVKGAAPASALSQSRPALRGSASADSLPKAGGTPESSLPGSSGLSNSNSIDNSTQTDVAASSASNFGSRKIRFAPLPDPRRPRRYSTGRDIWLDEDPDNVHINSRGGVEARTDEWGTPGAGESSAGGLAGGESLSLYPSPMSIPGSSSQGYAGSEDSGMSPGSGLFGSFSSTTSAGNAGSSSHKRGASTGSSLTSKLLNPLKLGRSSKDKELKRTTSLESNGGGAGSLSTSAPVSPALASWLSGSSEPLGRRISTGTVGDQPSRERARAEEFRPTGIPMRLSTTQESDGPGAGMPRPRKAYPSVAQGGRGRRRQIRTSAQSAEPVFREWTNPTLGSSSNADEEDGSGMAWLKKRRAEREAKEKEEKERAAREAAEAAAGAADGDAPAAASAAATSSSSAPSQGSTADASGAEVPALHVIPDTPGLAGHSVSSSGADQRVNASDGDLELDDEDDGDDVDGSRRRSLSEEGTSGDEDISDDESSDGGVDDKDDDDDDNDDNDDSDDLTQAELEEEERLVEEARRTTEGAGREVFHSHEHHASTHRVDKGSRQNSLVAPLSSGTATPTLAGARSVDASRRGSPVPPHSASPDRYAGSRPVAA